MCTFSRISGASIIHQHMIEWLLSPPFQLIHAHLILPLLQGVAHRIPAGDHTFIVVSETWRVILLRVQLYLRFYCVTTFDQQPKFVVFRWPNIILKDNNKPELVYKCYTYTGKSKVKYVPHPKCFGWELVVTILPDKCLSSSVALKKWIFTKAITHKWTFCAAWSDRRRTWHGRIGCGAWCRLAANTVSFNTDAS